MNECAPISPYGGLLRRLVFRRNIGIGYVHTRLWQPVERRPPGDTSEKRSFVFQSFPFICSIDLQKSFLHNILRIMRISKNRISHTEDKTGLPRHEGRKTLV